MVQYCKQNKIILQMSKCKFMVINGSEMDKLTVTLDCGDIKCVRDVFLLGTGDTGVKQCRIRSPFERTF